MTMAYGLSWKQSVWQNPDLERTYQNARIYLKTTSCHLMNELFYQTINWFKLYYFHTC